MQDSGSLAMFKVTARDQGHKKGPSGAFVTVTFLVHFLISNGNSKQTSATLFLFTRVTQLFIPSCSTHVYETWGNTIKCLSIGTPKTINFPFVPDGNLMILDVPIFEHIIIRL